ncbi:hypothetical protein GCM10023085_18720 [Actinomadura viridis]|uniref:Anti-sigma regulatory factor (Ser/Thr protein kinase) n=1 Tax=Actinomadura viridis TaxID=58110 RepID=A0A931DKS9_9ACTN|nr:ATP-binding protein [Actinomadura viridis]MBG6089371.1 hypothetical protein [Actinomadura viridis]
MRQAARDLAGGAAVAWVLPADRTCAGVASSLLGDLLGALRVPRESAREAQMMISEVATNALEHAGGPGELWAYRAGGGVVCGVSDRLPEKAPPLRPVPFGSQDLTCEYGRGMALVDVYAKGEWGVHRTRGQLGGHVPGKVVWFRVGAQLPALRGGHPSEMARNVRDRLCARGVNGVIVSQSPRLALVSVCHGLDVWCRAGRFQVREPAAGRSSVRPAEEIAAVVEHAVRRYEELCRGAS